MGLQWKTLEVQIKHVEGSSGLTVPVDQAGVDYLVMLSSMEIINFPEYLEAITKIFDHAGVTWTLSTQCFEATNAGIQIGNKDIAAESWWSGWWTRRSSSGSRTSSARSAATPIPPSAGRGRT